MSRRLHAAYGNRVAVVNAGIGGRDAVGPTEYGPEKPFPGGPSAGQRLERDVLRLSGVTTVIWLEGINDFSKSGNAAVEDVVAEMRECGFRRKSPTYSEMMPPTIPIYCRPAFRLISPTIPG